MADKKESKSEGDGAEAPKKSGGMKFIIIVVLLLAIEGGVLFFLAGHAVESTFLPLEIYFEHRNYLPSMGLLLVLAGAAQAAAPMLARATPAFRGALAGLLLLFVASLTWATHGRARVWAEPDLLLLQALEQSPDSPRVNLMLVGASLSRGDVANARTFLARTELVVPEKNRAVVALAALMISCIDNQAPDQRLFDDVAARAPGIPSTMVFHSAIALEDLVMRQRCPSIDPGALAEAYLQWNDRLAVHRNDMRSWRMRFMSARLLGQAGRLQEAIGIIGPAWADSGFDVGIGITIARLQEALSDGTGLAMTISQLQATTPRWDRTAWAEIRRLQAFKTPDDGL